MALAGLTPFWGSWGDKYGQSTYTTAGSVTASGSGGGMSAGSVYALQQQLEKEMREAISSRKMMPPMLSQKMMVSPKMFENLDFKIGVDVARDTRTCPNCSYVETMTCVYSRRNPDICPKCGWDHRRSYQEDMEQRHRQQTEEMLYITRDGELTVRSAKVRGEIKLPPSKNASYKKLYLRALKLRK